MDGAQGRHAQQLEDMYEQLVTEARTQEMTTRPWCTTWTHMKEQCYASPAVCLSITGILALAILLILRPPFVLTFERDARQPWRGVVRFSWFSMFVALLMTLTVASGLPLLVGLAATRGT